MAPSRAGLSLVVANLLIPIAIVTFAVGFFPYKPFLPGLAKYEDAEDVTPPLAPFNKVVFMVVDALRSDFVYSEGSGFAYTQNLISGGSAMPFTAHATSPTITMPRIKAITTGSIPSFLDVILNFAESDTSSSLATQDTWLAQMKAKGTGKMTMFGDDTWIKLFPGTFDRVEGTSSFFVADFTEVDHNVTRNIPKELMEDDWNTMILHYLGLDHIGHKSGPRSPNMLPKQEEMDGIVQQIYEAMETYERYKNTLLVLCGDHGMNDAGNHGGSATGETSPALVFISPKLRAISAGSKTPAPMREDFQYYTTVEQSDIVPTLGGLLGFPSPRNNLGAFIADFLPFWSQADQKVRILLLNAKQVLNIVAATFPSVSFAHRDLIDCSVVSSDIERLACEWEIITHQLGSRNSGEQHKAELVFSLTQWLKMAQGIMRNTASNYDITKLIVGQAAALAASALAFFAAIPTLSRSWAASLPFLIIIVTYGMMMFASSYVEEEHNFWYWMSSGWLVQLSFNCMSRRSMRGSSMLAIGAFAVLATLRIVRRWNQTGQKFAGEPDIARTFLSQHNIALWGLVGATYLWNAALLANNGFHRLPRTISTTIAALLFTISASFKLAFTMEDAPELLQSLTLLPSFLTTLPGSLSLVTRARGVFLGIGMALCQTIGAELLLKQRRPMDSHGKSPAPDL
ncbi:MAG: major facilitator super transporter protein [Claussenomyces sp. TS43310]|nr:MAG: major facilitator super transporter protein [Claussenomyces sp. TS43310]